MIGCQRKICWSLGTIKQELYVMFANMRRQRRRHFDAVCSNFEASSDVEELIS